MEKTTVLRTTLLDFVESVGPENCTREDIRLAIAAQVPDWKATEVEQKKDLATILFSWKSKILKGTTNMYDGRVEAVMGDYFRKQHVEEKQLFMERENEKRENGEMTTVTIRSTDNDDDDIDNDYDESVAPTYFKEVAMKTRQSEEGDKESLKRKFTSNELHQSSHTTCSSSSFLRDVKVSNKGSANLIAGNNSTGSNCVTVSETTNVPEREGNHPTQGQHQSTSIPTTSIRDSETKQNDFLASQLQLQRIQALTRVTQTALEQKCSPRDLAMILSIFKNNW